MSYKTSTTIALATAFCGVMATSAIADENPNFNEDLCLGDVQDSGGLSPLELIDGFNILSAGTGKATMLYFAPQSRLHFTETPPMFGWPTLHRMHDDSRWCYVAEETFDNAAKVLVNPNTPTFEA
jgi:hypothetical protein